MSALCLLVGWKFVSENVNWKGFVRFCLSFGLVFAIGITYLNLSSLSGTWTSIWTAWVVATIFATSFHFSAHIRCSTVIFFLECLSPFGLFMLFLSASWIAIQEVLEGFTSTYDITTSSFCKNNSSPTEESIDYVALKDLMVLLHYLGFLPYLLIYLHSLFFVVTFSQKQPKRKVKNSHEVKSSKCSKLVVSFRVVMSFMVGVVFSCTVSVWGSEKLHKHVILSSIHTLLCKTAVESLGDSLCLSIYLAVCSSFLIIIPFTNLLAARRAPIIKYFFNIKNELPESRRPKKPILKPKNQRRTICQVKDAVYNAKGEAPSSTDGTPEAAKSAKIEVPKDPINHNAEKTEVLILGKCKSSIEANQQGTDETNTTDVPSETDGNDSDYSVESELNRESEAGDEKNSVLDIYDFV